MAKFKIGDIVQCIKADEKDGAEPETLGHLFRVTNVDEEGPYPIVARSEEADIDFAFELDELKVVIPLDI